MQAPRSRTPRRGRAPQAEPHVPQHRGRGLPRPLLDRLTPEKAQTSDRDHPGFRKETSHEPI
jgi:hypothetical protein